MARRYSAISGQTCTDQVLPSHGCSAPDRAIHCSKRCEDSLAPLSRILPSKLPGFAIGSRLDTGRACPALADSSARSPYSVAVRCTARPASAPRARRSRWSGRRACRAPTAPRGRPAAQGRLDPRRKLRRPCGGASTASTTSWRRPIWTGQSPARRRGRGGGRRRPGTIYRQVWSNLVGLTWR